MKTQGQAPQFGFIPPSNRQFSGQGGRPVDYEPSALVLSQQNEKVVPCYTGINNHKAEALDNVHLGHDGHPFSLGQRPSNRTVPPNIKEILQLLIECLPAEIIDGGLKLFARLLVDPDNCGQDKHVQAVPADSHFKDMLQVVLAAYGIKPSQQVVDNIELRDAVKLVFKAMINLKKDLFKKVELTIALQKQLSAHEIAEAIDFLISEGGVIVEIEQIKKRNGRNPSPQYRLLWENSKYQRV
jgi:hypothetical protein